MAYPGFGHCMFACTVQRTWQNIAHEPAISIPPSHQSGLMFHQQLSMAYTGKSHTQHLQIGPALYVSRSSEDRKVHDLP